MAIRFDTAADGYSISSGLPSNSIPTSIMFWVMLVVDTDSYQTFLSDNDTNYYFGCGPNGTTLEFYDGGDRSSGRDLVVGQWYHVALVSSGTNRKIYLDGALVLDYTAASSSDVPTAYYFGATSGGSFTLNGRMAAIKLYSAALSQLEVQREMRQNAPTRKIDLHAWWPWIDLDSATIDYSGQGRTLTQLNTPITEDNPPIPWEMAITPYLEMEAV